MLRPGSREKLGVRLGPVGVTIGMAGAAALVLGFLGYRETSEDLSFTDAAFQALQLFVFEGGTTAGATPWQLDVARFLAAAVAGYALLRAVLFLARSQADEWRTRLLARDHVVVIGLSDVGLAVAKGHARGGAVVCVEDASEPRAESCRKGRGRIPCSPVM